jgi:hypothetical protein
VRQLATTSVRLERTAGKAASAAVSAAAVSRRCQSAKQSRHNHDVPLGPSQDGAQYASTMVAADGDAGRGAINDAVGALSVKTGLWFVEWLSAQQAQRSAR